MIARLSKKSRSAASLGKMYERWRVCYSIVTSDRCTEWRHNIQEARDEEFIIPLITWEICPNTEEFRWKIWSSDFTSHKATRRASSSEKELYERKYVFGDGFPADEGDDKCKYCGKTDCDGELCKKSVWG